jgi:hypothetical protein
MRKEIDMKKYKNDFELADKKELLVIKELKLITDNEIKKGIKILVSPNVKKILKKYMNKIK